VLKRDVKLQLIKGKEKERKSIYQWRSQELFPTGAKFRGLGDGSPPWGPEAKPRRGSGGFAPEANDLTIKYSTY